MSPDTVVTILPLVCKMFLVIARGDNVTKCMWEHVKTFSDPIGLKLDETKHVHERIVFSVRCARLLAKIVSERTMPSKPSVFNIAKRFLMYKQTTSENTFARVIDRITSYGMHYTTMLLDFERICPVTLCLDSDAHYDAAMSERYLKGFGIWEIMVSAIMHRCSPREVSTSRTGEFVGRTRNPYQIVCRAAHNVESLLCRQCVIWDNLFPVHSSGLCKELCDAKRKIRDEDRAHKLERPAKRARCDNIIPPQLKGIASTLVLPDARVVRALHAHPLWHGISIYKNRICGFRYLRKDFSDGEFMFADAEPVSGNWQVAFYKTGVIEMVNHPSGVNYHPAGSVISAFESTVRKISDKMHALWDASSEPMSKHDFSKMCKDNSFM